MSAPNGNAGSWGTRLGVILGLAVAALSAVLTALCCVMCGGPLSPLALWVWQASNATDRPALQAAAGAFLDDVQAGRLDSAYGKTSAGFRAANNPAQFRALVASYPALSAHGGRSFDSWGYMGGAGSKTGEVGMTVATRGGPFSFTLHFVEESGGWKVENVTVP